MHDGDFIRFELSRVLFGKFFVGKSRIFEVDYDVFFAEKRKVYRALHQNIVGRVAADFPACNESMNDFSRIYLPFIPS